MKKKRAFTLVELLAVIVILAIISLIAVPIVLGIINDAKKSSEEESLKLYFDTVEKAITRKQLSSSNFNPDRCEIQSDGNLECFNNNETFSLVLLHPYNIEKNFIDNIHDTAVEIIEFIKNYNEIK